MYLTHVRGTPRTPESAASRISAYVYGNILVLAALVPVTLSRTYWGIAIVAGVALSTYIAHIFAHALVQNVHAGRELTRSERLTLLPDAMPIVTSAALPCAILATAGLHWTDPRNVQLLAEVVILIRIALIVFVVERFQGNKPSGGTLVFSVVIALLAAVIVVIKVFLTH
ncbi:hypothetical protein [Janibacter cremeus]|uniref:Putative membrane protein n=1 Tax=Janibacter cremeus TaxID=1285192 RepID=A0A852VU28_9MICO|nr:hypothetical protein [Janibacter cremeus]NYF98900.1 putative membrane protein [Janibacter cremeus]